ncbi:hypothetical protein [Halobaculum sp. EA56]|uniref:hypothetical protein n=1 Tax=Halobaculum sp. EA56 TaxID=3421648 RepID=UPI003EBD7407
MSGTDGGGAGGTDGGDGSGGCGNDGPGTHAGPADGALAVARGEGRATLEAQLSAMDEVDAKALSVFRLNVALVGVLLSALSVAAASGAVDVGGLLTPVVGAATLLFGLSAAAAGLTYVAVGRRVGVAPAGLRAAVDADASAFRRRLVEGYADWIRANERANDRKALLVSLSVLGTVAGTLALVVGVVGALAGTLLVPAAVAALVTVGLAVLFDLPGQVRRITGPTDGSDDPGEGTVAPRAVDDALDGQRAGPGRDPDG